MELVNYKQTFHLRHQQIILLLTSVLDKCWFKRRKDATQVQDLSHDVHMSSGYFVMVVFKLSERFATDLTALSRWALTWKHQQASSDWVCEVKDLNAIAALLYLISGQASSQNTWIISKIISTWYVYVYVFNIHL